MLIKYTVNASRPHNWQGDLLIDLFRSEHLSHSMPLIVIDFLLHGACSIDYHDSSVLGLSKNLSAL